MACGRDSTGLAARADPRLARLLAHPAIWRGRSIARSSVVPTGFSALDAALPGNGWPQVGLVEVLTAHLGTGELPLLLPALAHLSREPAARWCAWIAPPLEPFAPALAAHGVSLSRVLVVRAGRGRARMPLWACEQALRSGACEVALAWVEPVAARALRRLQLATERGRTLAFVFRTLCERTVREPSNAALRIAVEPAGSPAGEGVRIRLLKSRGGSREAVDLRFRARRDARAMSTRTSHKAAGHAAPARSAQHLIPLDPPVRPDALPQSAGALPQWTGAPPLPGARELWIGAHFPQLALEALGSAPPLAPAAVAEFQGRARCIVAANEAAARAGVRAGMSVSAALALAPQLTVESRDPRREQALLERLAALAQRFTPRVSLAPPDGLTLEVKGSLHLFGGVGKLGAGFLAGCRSAGSRPRLALAPTALAALAGARSGKPFKVSGPARLIGALAPLPLAVLRWPPEVLERLAKVGVRTIGAALRLPRAGLARRFGAETLASLDRLVGQAADLRGSFRAPERFRMRRACTYELERHEAVLAALAPLLESLGKFLEARQRGITQLECRLWHRHAPPTQCVLKLAAPGADPRRLSALLGERLAAVTLPEPVRSCELRSGALVPLALDAHGLWQPGEHGGGARAESTDLIECLRARLGVEAVHGLQVHPTHRPEAASQGVEAASRRVEATSQGGEAAPVPWSAFRRPLWLLPAPEPLSEIEGLPQRRGPLRLIGDPERIETGWWEGEVVRDYYPAVDSHGVRLWVFRERKQPHRWFLQGVFG